MTIKEKYEKAQDDLEAGTITPEDYMLIEQEYVTWVKSKPTSQMING